MLTSTTIIHLLQQNKPYLQERFGVESLVLFGSFVNNHQQVDSDIDLLYQVAEGKTMPLMRLQGLEKFISQLMNDRKIELVSQKHAEPIIQSTIQKEGILVF